MARGIYNAKPTEQLKANGTYRPVYHANRVEVETVDEIPPCPADLDKEHKTAWVEFCERLRNVGILTGVDYYAIRTFVEAQVTARKTYALMSKEGFVIDGKKHPAHLVYAEAVKTMRALYDQFGLTPRARMGLRVEKKKKEDDPIAKLAKAMSEGNA